MGCILCREKNIIIYDPEHICDYDDITSYFFNYNDMKCFICNKTRYSSLQKPLKDLYN